MKYLDRAIKIATEYHLGQYRHGGIIPYIVHPLEVCKTAFDLGITDDEMLSAYVLHDTIEDTKYTEQLLREDFTKRIADIVMEMTKIGVDDSIIQNKIEFIHTFRNKSKESILGKITDRYCNTLDYKKTGNREWFPAYYALQAVDLYRSFINKREEFDKNIFLKYYNIVQELLDIVYSSYSINHEVNEYIFLNKKETYNEKIYNLIVTRNKGKFE
jgi:hypothetical protein